MARINACFSPTVNPTAISTIIGAVIWPIIGPVNEAFMAAERSTVSVASETI